MAMTIDQRIAAIEAVLIDVYDKKIPDMFAEMHPFGDKLFSQSEKLEAKTWKRKFKIRHSHNPQISPVATAITPGDPSSPAWGEVTRTVRAVSSRAYFLEDTFMHPNDPVGTKAMDEVNAELKDHFEGNVRLIIKEFMSGDGQHPVLFEIPYDAALPNSYAVDVEVPVYPEQFENIWPGCITDVINKGTGAEVAGGLMIKTKRDNSTTYPGWSCTVTFDTALTGGAAIPARCVVVPQNSYSYALEGLPALLNEDSSVDYMGEKADDVSDWAPVVFDAAGGDISLVENVGPVVHKLRQRGAKDLWMLMTERQQYKLEQWIRNHQVVHAKPLEMKGGWQAMQLTVRSTPLKYMVDGWWCDDSSVAIVDLADLKFHFWGDKPVYFNKRGGGEKAGTGFINRHPTYENVYYTTILSYPSGLLTEFRKNHAKIKNLAV